MLSTLPWYVCESDRENLLLIHRQLFTLQKDNIVMSSAETLIQFLIALPFLSAGSQQSLYSSFAISFSPSFHAETEF